MDGRSHRRSIQTVLAALAVSAVGGCDYYLERPHDPFEDAGATVDVGDASDSSLADAETDAGDATVSPADGGDASDGAVCGPGTSRCGASCVDIQLDPSNCGGCGKTCDNGKVCSNGACGLTCGGGTVKCGQACVAILSDPANCGGCLSACATSEVCSSGSCKLACPGAQIDCAGSCVDPLTSRSYCGATGACGNGGGSVGAVCGSGNICDNGTCVVSCPGTQINCGGACIEPSTSNTHCGATGQCGNGGGSAGTPCAQGTTCTGGSCL